MLLFAHSGRKVTNFSNPYPFGRLDGIQVGVHKSLDASEESIPRKEHTEARSVAMVERKGRKDRSPQDHGEARLVALAKQGDERAVGELYRRHVDMIYRYTYARVKDWAAAEDLTAQVFLKALEGLPNYEHTGAPFRAWLYRIAHARTVDYWRQQQRRQEVVLVDTLPARDPLPEEVVVARSQWDDAIDLLTNLTDDQRDVIMLRFIEEMSLAEAADTLGKTIGAVKALQHRALASLARLLKQRAAESRDQHG
jgi:RNA polymerase sigma-70 factor (ECF subfamily)